MGNALSKKLRMHTIQNALIINAPNGYVQSVHEGLDEVEISQQAEGTYEFVQLFVKNSEEYNDLSLTAFEAVEYDGLLWISYPKKSGAIKSDLTRDVLWEMTKGTGYRPVTQISIDDTWSALRFRPEDAVGK
jgi:hypothetical protein